MSSLAPPSKTFQLLTLGSEKEHHLQKLEHPDCLMHLQPIIPERPIITRKTHARTTKKKKRKRKREKEAPIKLNMTFTNTLYFHSET